MVKINGEALAVAGKTLAEYLAGTDYNPKRIAVERNGEIVPKAAYGETILQDGDVIEVVNFVASISGTTWKGCAGKIQSGNGCHLRFGRSWLQYCDCLGKSRRWQADSDGF